MAGSIVNYSFCTQQGDVDFGITFTPAAADGQAAATDGNTNKASMPSKEEVLEEHRVPSDVEPISGVFRSPQEGTITFFWDNAVMVCRASGRFGNPFRAHRGVT